MGKRYFLCGCGQALSGKGAANAGSPLRQTNLLPSIFFILFIFILLTKLLPRSYRALALGSPT